MSNPQTTKITYAQHRQLKRIDQGGLLTIRERTGGAVFRMLDRMATAGLITSAPHKLTKAGRKAMNDMTETTLDDFTAAELLAEIEDRKTRKIIKLQARKPPKVWTCRCGYRYVAGSHDNESYVDFGMLWHKSCMPPQGQLSGNPQMSMGSANV